MRMRKKLLDLSKCTSGDVIARDVYGPNGILLVAEGTKLNDFLIEQLSKREVAVIPVLLEFEPNQGYDEQSFHQFVESYGEKVDSIKGMIQELAAGKPMDYSKVSGMVDSIYQQAHEKNHITVYLSTLKSYDQYTYHHSINVALYSMLIAQWLNLPEQQIKEAIQAGMLHDIGKSLIPAEIINKRGRLEEEEFALVKKHPVIGYNLAKTVPELSEAVLKGILMHHEREDGTGYPLGASGEQIGIIAKIVAVADVYDALTSQRAYKPRQTPFHTFQLMERTGLGHFDTRILLTFLKNIASYYTGAGVIVNTGKKGRVAYVAPHNISRPVVELGRDYVDMAREEELDIVEMID